MSCNMRPKNWPISPYGLPDHPSKAEIRVAQAWDSGAKAVGEWAEGRIAELATALEEVLTTYCCGKCQLSLDGQKLLASARREDLRHLGRLGGGVK